MHRICVVGAGEVGSRHLQALAAVKFPLEIVVVDPQKQSLTHARQRYEAVAFTYSRHKIIYETNLPTSSSRKIDLAIVATTAEVRAEAIRALLKHSKVRYLILEKLLFQKKPDYQEIGRLLHETKTQAWVNCTMRTMPFYYELKKQLDHGPIKFQSRFSNFGLISNAIHYLDYLVFLTGCREFSLDFSELNPKPVESKRKGFLEFKGTLTAKFTDGSQMSVTSTSNPQPEIEILIEGAGVRLRVYDLEEKAFLAKKENHWQEKEIKAQVPFISEMTTGLVNNLLERGTCMLTSFEESQVVHLRLLEPVLEFLNKHSPKKYNYYPFT